MRRPNPDALRSPDQLHLADERMAFFTVRDRDESRPLSQNDRHASIERFQLCAEVPNDVRVHFDTARNLYLYAWFVYRFHVVAEQQALASLEMALRLALIERNVLDKQGRALNNPPSKMTSTVVRRRPTRPALQSLLRLAVDNGILSNARLVNRFLWAQAAAERRVQTKQIESMLSSNATALEIPNEPAIPSPDELDYDWIGAFIEALPTMRNAYAHGSSRVHATVLRTFEVVSDLINQLFTLRETDTSASLSQPA